MNLVSLFNTFKTYYNDRELQITFYFNPFQHCNNTSNKPRLKKEYKISSIWTKEKEEKYPMRHDPSVFKTFYKSRDMTFNNKNPLFIKNQ